MVPLFLLSLSHCYVVDDDDTAAVAVVLDAEFDDTAAVVLVCTLFGVVVGVVGVRCCVFVIWSPNNLSIRPVAPLLGKTTSTAIKLNANRKPAKGVISPTIRASCGEEKRSYTQGRPPPPQYMPLVPSPLSLPPHLFLH